MVAGLISRFWWEFCRVVSRRSDAYGVRIWYLMPLGDEARVASERIGRALELIATHDPRQLKLFHGIARGIIIVDHPMLFGSWEPGARLVRLSESFLRSDRATPTMIAMTIVHELAHARLGARKFAYEPKRRHRIEAICFRAEAAFARKVPGGEELADRYEKRAERTIAAGPDDYSDRALRELSSRALEIVGAPRWILRAMRRRAARTPNER